MPEERNIISTHRNLEIAYNASKMKAHTKLKHWFFGNGQTQKRTDDDWSYTGAWKGDSCTDGWPGGASVAHSSNRLTLKQLQRKKNAERQQGLRSNVRDAMSRNLSNGRKTVSQKFRKSTV
mmetsp:Transcript_26452/g.25295  ORF Transcript_26452/g.25295 Transcript_26452/m.25295 type:complete len:121 (-) Transcript_26452:109-471(-)